MLKSILLVILYLVIGGVVGGCAGRVPLPKQIPEALNAACDLYTKAKPEVIKAREYAKAHWNDKVPGSDQDLIPAEVKKTLLEFDAILPKLDGAGLAICSSAEGISTFQATIGAGEKIDWNEVLTVVLKGASIALDMKSKGVI